MTAALRRQLRRQFRQQRRSLTPGQRRRASLRFGRRLDQALGHRPARHLALYLANDGELDLRPALGHSRFQLATTYLPRLDPIRRGHLQFRLWQRHHPMRPNHYGIAEPAHYYRGRALWALDVILLPAVAFDACGYRLGMGEGITIAPWRICNADRGGPGWWPWAMIFRRWAKGPYRWPRGTNR